MYDPKTITGTNHRDLQCLHPYVAGLAQKFIDNANKALANTGYSVKIVSTLRTWPEQQAIYNQGRTTPGHIVTNAKPGDSMHNWGVAFDIGIFKGNEYNPADGQHYYKDLSTMGKMVGLKWGGDWISIKDYPHYEYIGTHSDSEFIALAKAGHSIDELIGQKS